MDNLNLKGNFLLTFERIPNVAYYMQDTLIPGMSIGEVIVPNPALDYTIPGDKLTFDKLNINFIVDEELDNYAELLHWFMDMRDPDICAKADLYSDATITILSNNKNPIREFKFYDCFPILLDSLSFNYNSDPVESQICSTTIAYTYFKLSDKK